MRVGRLSSLAFHIEGHFLTSKIYKTSQLTCILLRIRLAFHIPHKPIVSVRYACKITLLIPIRPSCNDNQITILDRIKGICPPILICITNDCDMFVLDDLEEPLMRSTS